MKGSLFTSRPPRYRDGDAVDVWSRSDNKWCPGEVTGDVDQGGLVQVQYRMLDGSARTKLMHSSSPDLKQAVREGEPVSGTAYLCEQDNFDTDSGEERSGGSMRERR